MVDVVIGILLAPAKGSETWKKWVGGLNDLKDKRVDKEKKKPVKVFPEWKLNLKHRSISIVF